MAYTANNNNFVADSRMTSVDEEGVDNNLLSINDKHKDPRVCNERSDSGFSECSNCSTPSASCVCNLTQIEKSDTIVEEQYSTSTAEPCEETQSESRSEISSLEYDDANKGNCDNSSQNEEDDIVLSICVPTRRELYQNDVPMSEIERRKVSLENDTVKKSKSGASAREEFSLEKLKKTSKVALLMEKFEATSSSPPAAPSANFKFKAVTNDDDDEGLIKSTTPNPPNSVPSITNNVKICDLTRKEPSLDAVHETNHNSTTHSLVAKPTSPAATRKSPTNHTTTFRLSDRVREATERLSKPKQQAASPTSMEKATKASILTKQNSNFARSKEFWKR
jgi:hypothetical protein